MEERNECVYCHTKLIWDETDDVHGNLFVCESCGDYFCEKCFIDKLGSKNFTKMFFSYACECPDCFKNTLKEEEKEMDRMTPCDLGECPFDAQYSEDCRRYCGVGVDEDSYPEEGGEDYE